MNKTNFTYFITWFIFLVMSQNLAAQAGSVAGNRSFAKRYDNTLNGNLSIVANSIIGRLPNPNENFNRDGNNNQFESGYIDIDNDPTTFSSSSADYENGLDCSRVVYAGLYWSAAYPLDGDPSADSYPPNDRRPDFRSVKFKIPGGNYVDINPSTAPHNTEEIFDGYPNSPTNPTNLANKDAPYVCYADVTDLVAPQTDPTGTYTVANIRGYTGQRRGGGATGGWILVIVHENPLETRKYVASYDGFSSVEGRTSDDYIVDGFTTIPNGPVRAEYSIGALEGDLGIVNDNLNIRADRNTTFTRLSNAANPGNNFFNSSITSNGANVTNRLPNGTNTLGFDADNFVIPNALNLIVPNDETGATFRVQTSGDAYSVFMNAFSIEIIAPDLFVTKRVFDSSNNDITGGDVRLGQEIFYELTIQNIGNDDAVNAFILDDLPLNVNYIPGFLTAPSGVLISYDAANRQLRFDIDPSLIEIDDASFKIRFKTQVIENCSQLRDACSNIIENIATSSYQGALNPSPVVNERSFFSLDECNLGVVGSSNFLINTDECDFVRNEVLCGDSLIITAGNGYDRYTWTDETGVVIGTTQSITVTRPGTYTVSKETVAPCVDDDETVIVDFFSAITNPLIDEADNVRTCGIDGSALPEFFLCGINDSRLINLDLQDASRISWQMRDPDSCPAQTDLSCPNTNTSCVWNEVQTGPDFLIDTAGQYRVRLEFINGCFRTFFFNVYENTIDPNIRVIDPIVCDNPGSIEVLDVPSTGYEFSLNNTGPYQTSTIFTGLTVAGNYTVFIRQTGGLDTACIFQESIDLPEFNFDVDVIVNDILCNDDQGSITVQITNGLPNYDYRITNSSGLDLSFNTDESTYTFDNLVAGLYEIEATGSDGICIFSESVEIEEIPDLNVSATVIQNIDCEDGLIRLSSDGGSPNYQYAIYSYNGNPIDPTTYVFQSETDFIFVNGEEGTYVFIVADQNNCTSLTAPVELRLEPTVVYDVIEVDPLCEGDSNGSLEINVTVSGTGNLTYSIDGGITFQSSNRFNGLSAGTYDIVVRSSNLNNICDVASQNILEEPDAINADISLISDLTCADDARIEVLNVTGGTAPYMYSLDGITYGASTSFDVSTSGDYTISVRDANDCVFQTAPVTIDELDLITDLSFTQNALTCPTLVTDVTVTATGGTAPFTYEIVAPATDVFNNGTNNTFTDLAAGTYTIRVTDSKFCFIEESVTIAAVNPITTTGQLVSNVTCFGDSDGTFRYLVSDFASSYDYTVTGPLTFTGTTVTDASLDFTGPAGTYTITVTDNTTNCTDTAVVIVESPTAALMIDTIDIDQLSCSPSGDVPGSVSITTSGGWGSNQYTLTRPDGLTVGPQNSASFSNLNLTGTYTITVTDLNGCAVLMDFQIDPTTSPDLSLALDDVCYDAISQGTIIASVVSGGQSPFSYQINGGASQASNTFTNLVPGSYTITVTDANNCTDTDSITINPELIASATLIKNLDCTASPDAQIDVMASGGNPSYSYEVSVDGNPFTSYTGSFPFLASNAGSYRFRVSDTSNCLVITNPVIVNTPIDPNIIDLSQIDEVQCNGDDNGSFQINLDPTAGVAPFEITVNGSPVGDQTTINGLTAGTYVVVVTDANGCTDTDTITIGQPDVITANVTFESINCDPSTLTGLTPGSISIAGVTGGTAGFTYTISNNFGDTFNFIATTGQDHTFNNLSFGFYDVIIEDANGCNLIERVALASPPDDLDIDVTSIPGSCATGASVIVTVDASVGSGNYSFAILRDNDPASPANIFLPADPGTPNSRRFDGLDSGVIYTFIVRDDSSGCFFIKESELATPIFSNLMSSIDPNDISCTGSLDGSISFTFDGYDAGSTSVDYEIFNAGSTTSTGLNSTAAVNPPTGPITVNDFGTLGTGRYFILFTERGGPNDGCRVASDVFTISESPNPLALTVNNVRNDNCGTNRGIVTARGSFGTAPYEYIILPQGSPMPDASDIAWRSSSTFFVEGGNYTVYIKDALDCIISEDTFVDTDPNPDIVLSIVDNCVAEGTYQITVDFANATDRGTPNYRLFIDGNAAISVTSLPFIIDNLSSGSHTVSFRDRNNCIDTETIIIESPLVPASQIITQPSCANDDGVIGVSATGGSGNYSFDLLDSSSVSVGATFTAGQFTGLGFGDYIIQTTDVITGCIATQPVSLEEPTDILLALPTITDVSCNGASDGQINVNLDPSAASIAGIAYELLDSTGTTVLNGPQTSSLFTGLAAGDYVIRVTSGNNCSALQNVTVEEPSQLAISATATTFVCAADNTVNLSRITVSIDDDALGNPSGTAPYSYSIDGVNFQNSNLFDVADTGMIQNITVTVADANNCRTTTNIVIQPLPVITDVTVAQTQDFTCITDELVTVTVTGGSGTFTYELLPTGPVFNNVTSQTQDFALTTSGDYTFRVTDEVTGCFFITTPYTVDPTIDPVVNLTKITDISCAGASDGVLEIDVQNYTGAYDYDIVDTAGNTVLSGTGNTAVNPERVTTLGPGRYSVIITESSTPFCSDQSNIALIETPVAPLQLNLEVTNDLSCTPGADGSITATAIDGWGDYSYSFEGGPFTQTRTFNNLNAGTYTITVRDRTTDFCEVSSMITIEPTVDILATATGTTLQCEGDTNGTITVNATGGQGPGSYIYQLNLPDGSTSARQNSPVFNNLPAGNYSVTVTDNLNCDVVTNPVVINNPPEVIAQATLIQNATCLQDASILITAVNGVAPYTYSQDGINFTNNNRFTGLREGTYSFIVRDANGCESPVSNGITIEPIIDLAATQDLSSAFINCSGEADAQIRINATGGLGNYRYELFNDSDVSLAGPQVEDIFRNIGAGTFYVEVTSVDCTFRLPAFTVDSPDAITATIEKTDISCFGEDDGRIVVNANGGTGELIYSLDQLRYDTINEFNNLAPGDYTVYVQDATGCFLELPMTIEEPLELTGTSVITSQNVCPDDEFNDFEVTIQGGTAPYDISIDNVDFISITGNTFTFENLDYTISYPVFIRDANGCETIVTPITFDPPLMVQAEPVISYDCDGGNILTITGIDTSNNANYLYSLDGQAGQLSPVFTNLTPGDHFVEIQDINNGCNYLFTNILVEFFEPMGNLTVTEIGLNLYELQWTGGTPEYERTLNGTRFSGNTFTIDADGEYEIVVTDSRGCFVIAQLALEFIDIDIPNFFTPDGNGENDLWTPDNIERFPDSDIFIFDRYGRLLHQYKGAETGWDGIYQNKLLPSGDYWYAIELNDDENRVFKGHFTLYR